MIIIITYFRCYPLCFKKLIPIKIFLTLSRWILRFECRNWWKPLQHYLVTRRMEFVARRLKIKLEVKSNLKRFRNLTSRIWGSTDSQRAHNSSNLSALNDLLANSQPILSSLNNLLANSIPVSKTLSKHWKISILFFVWSPMTLAIGARWVMWTIKKLGSD